MWIVENSRICFRWLLLTATVLITGLGCVAGKGIGLPSKTQAQDLFAVAEEFYENKQFIKAEKLYNEYLASNPDPTLADNALFRLGKIAMANQDYNLSLGFFQMIINYYQDSELMPSARFETAHSYFLNSSYNNALQELIRFQRDFPRSQYDPDVQFMLSEVYIKTRQYSKAKEAASTFIRLYPESPLKAKALYQLGLSLMYLGEADPAIGYFKQALRSGIPEDQRQNAFYALGTLYLTKGDLRLAVDYFSNLVKLTDTGERKTRVVQKIEGLMKNQFSNELLMEIIQEHSYEFPGDLAIIEMGERKFKEGKLVDARYYWELFLSNFPQHPKTPYVKKYLSHIEEELTLTYDKKFGCIAPLTGPLSEYGEKMVRGVKMAIEEYNQNFGTSIKVVLFDSQAVPEKARKGVELLAYQEKVAAIIGPLLTSTAMAASSVAEQIGIPLFTPTATGEGLPESGRFIFRNCLTNRHQAEALANYAVEEMGLTRFGILFSFNAYGQEMMSLFADRVEALGAEVEIIEFYDQEDTDFKEQLIRIHKIKPEALFLPGSYEKIVLIAPQIPFYEPEEVDPNDLNQLLLDISESVMFDGLDLGVIKKILIENEKNENEDEYVKEEEPIQLLGTDGWYDDRLIKEGRAYVEGAIVSVGFYSDSTAPQIRQFSLNFQTRYGQVPDLVSAQSFDATNMLLMATDGENITWDKIRDRVSLIQDFPGVSGRTTILPSGDSKKEVTLLQIKADEFTPIKRPYFNLRYGQDW